MAEYIERERLVKHYENCIDEVKNTNGIAEDFEICLKALKAQPAADVEEVKHGYWIDGKCGHYKICSECKQIADFDFDYCPNCGARMDDDGVTILNEELFEKIKKTIDNKFDTPQEKLSAEEFYDELCSGCGSQRGEGIGTVWFDGCIYKELLKEEEEK